MGVSATPVSERDHIHNGKGMYTFYTIGPDIEHAMALETVIQPYSYGDMVRCYVHMYSTFRPVSQYSTPCCEHVIASVSQFFYFHDPSALLLPQDVPYGQGWGSSSAITSWMSGGYEHLEVGGGPQKKGLLVGMLLYPPISISDQGYMHSSGFQGSAHGSVHNPLVPGAFPLPGLVADDEAGPGIGLGGLAQEAAHGDGAGNVPAVAPGNHVNAPALVGQAPRLAAFPAPPMMGPGYGMIRPGFGVMVMGFGP